MVTFFLLGRFYLGQSRLQAWFHPRSDGQAGRRFWGRGLLFVGLLLLRLLFTHPPQDVAHLLDLDRLVQMGTARWLAVLVGVGLLSLLKDLAQLGEDIFVLRSEEHTSELQSRRE